MFDSLINDPTIIDDARTILQAHQARMNAEAYERRARENRPWKPEEMDPVTLERTFGNPFDITMSF